MKKYLSGILALVMLLSFAFAGASFAEEKKVSVVTTIFPIYDWVREITAGDDNVEITMLLDNGVDLHSYEPTAQDILKVASADVFIYVGGESDEWVEGALAQSINPDMKVVNLVEAMGDDIKMEEIVEGMEHEHDHEHSHEKKEVTEDRSIEDFQGQWQSIYPYMAEPMFKDLAPYMAKAEGMEEDEAWEFFLKGNETTVRYVNIVGNEIEFIDESGATCKAAYEYDGWYSDCWGETSIRYQFKKVSGDDAAPTYVQFDDHLNYAVKAEHFHIYCGEDATAMLDIADNWPTYYPADIDSVEEMFEEYKEHFDVDDDEDENDHEHSEAHEKEVSTFEDNEVQDRSLTDWAGDWQSAYPYVLDGSLDEGFEHKAESGKMTAEEYKEYYKTGYETDIANIAIDGDTNVITYTDVNGNTCASEYTYLGYYIQDWSTGTRAAMYRFEAVEKESGAPIYIEFNDHIIEPVEAEHFHFRCSNTSFDDIEDPENKWPTFYPADYDADEMLDAFIGHDHHDDDEDEHDHDHEHEEDEADEHVWLSLKNAQKLVTVIAETMGEAVPVKADDYAANCAAYVDKLAALDAEYAAVREGADYDTVLFGDRFPFRYMVDDYDLNYFAAFSGCSAESEASFETIVFLAGKVDELGLTTVLTIEGDNHRIAETVVENTQAKDAAVLTMDSLQSTTAEDVVGGTTYLGVMEANLEVLKQALTK